MHFTASIRPLPPPPLKKKNNKRHSRRALPNPRPNRRPLNASSLRSSPFTFSESPTVATRVSPPPPPPSPPNFYGYPYGMICVFQHVLVLWFGIEFLCHNMSIQLRWRLPAHRVYLAIVQTIIIIIIYLNDFPYILPLWVIVQLILELDG